MSLIMKVTIMGNVHPSGTNSEQSGSFKPIRTVRLYLLIGITIDAVVILVRARDAYGLGSIFGFSGSILLSSWPYCLYFLGLVAGIVVIEKTRWSESLINFARAVLKRISSLGTLNWVMFASLILLYGYYQLGGISEQVLMALPPIWTFGHLGLLGALFLSGTRKIKPFYSVLVSFSFYGLVLWIIYFIPDVSNYPLSLGWSETSRYYYASLFFSPQNYGKWVPLSSLHPSRYLMQSVPFLIPSLPIWVHRLWQVLLWLGVTFIAGLALTRRIKPIHRLIGFGLTAWFFLFCFQGSVYYHLMVVIIIVLLGFNKDKLWRSLGFVVLASLWAGISRVNWFPVAGMLAVTLYILEIPQGKKNFWQYWRWPVLAVILGFALAFVSQAGYAAISGNPPSVFTSSFNSPLFRYRLFPNEAFGPGIINLTITASFPIVVIILWRILSRPRTWRFLRLLALMSILITLLMLGFVVSMKIGGGDNLHNLDSYLVILAVIAAYVGFNRFVPDDPEITPTRSLPTPLIVLALLIPLIFVLDMLRPFPDKDYEQAWEDIRKLQSLIDDRVQDGGEVLFIQNRHLLTFDTIKGVPLVPEYEKVFLMEMAMSGNETYLENFWNDLEIHRFDLIVVEPLAIVIRPATDVFGEENNVWVENVAKPLGDSYYSILDLHESGMSILAPKPVR